MEVISGTVFWSLRWDNLPACSTGRAVVAEGAIEVDETSVRRPLGGGRVSPEPLFN